MHLRNFKTTPITTAVVPLHSPAYSPPNGPLFPLIQTPLPDLPLIPFSLIAYLYSFLVSLTLMHRLFLPHLSVH